METGTADNKNSEDVPASDEFQISLRPNDDPEYYRRFPYAGSNWKNLTRRDAYTPLGRFPFMKERATSFWERDPCTIPVVPGSLLQDIVYFKFTTDKLGATDGTMRLPSTGYAFTRRVNCLNTEQVDNGVMVASGQYLYIVCGHKLDGEFNRKLLRWNLDGDYFITIELNGETELLERNDASAYVFEEKIYIWAGQKTDQREPVDLSKIPVVDLEKREVSSVEFVPEHPDQRELISNDLARITDIGICVLGKYALMLCYVDDSHLTNSLFICDCVNRILYRRQLPECKLDFPLEKCDVLPERLMSSMYIQDGLLKLCFHQAVIEKLYMTAPRPISRRPSTTANPYSWGSKYMIRPIYSFEFSDWQRLSLRHGLIAQIVKRYKQTEEPNGNPKFVGLVNKLLKRNYIRRLFVFCGKESIAEQHRKNFLYC